MEIVFHLKKKPKLSTADSCKRPIVLRKGTFNGFPYIMNVLLTEHT